MGMRQRLIFHLNHILRALFFFFRFDFFCYEVADFCVYVWVWVCDVSLCCCKLERARAREQRSLLSLYFIWFGLDRFFFALVHAVLLSFHSRHFSNGLRLHGDLVMRHKCAQHALELQTNGIHAKRNVIVAKQTEWKKRRTHTHTHICYSDNNGRERERKRAHAYTLNGRHFKNEMERANESLVFDHLPALSL